MRPVAYASSFIIVALTVLSTGAGCTTSTAPENGDDNSNNDNNNGNSVDVGEAAFTSVPSCRTFDLKATIAKTHDSSPDYQCEVSSTLSRSSQPSEAWIKSLSDPAIRQTPFHSVINLRGENGANGEDPIVRKYGMTPLNIRVIDMHAPTRDQVIEFLSFVTTRENQPALVHCHAGQGRTGTFVATYRMAVEGWAPADAINEARSFMANDEQLAFLQDFGTRLADPEIRRFRAGS